MDKDYDCKRMEAPTILDCRVIVNRMTKEGWHCTGVSLEAINKIVFVMKREKEGKMG